MWEYHYDTAKHKAEVQRWSDNTVIATLEYDTEYSYNAFGLRVIQNVRTGPTELRFGPSDSRHT